MTTTIHAAYWRDDMALLNLGDFLTEYLIEKMGFTYKRGGQKSPHLVWIIGSLLGSTFHEIYPRKDKIVWGCGHSGRGDMTAEQIVGSCDIRAVRGPLTAAKLGLPDTIPLGDPALLLPRFLRLTPVGAVSPDVGYMPHFLSRDHLPASTLPTIGANKFIDIACARDGFEARIEEIVSVNFLLTSSLHGAIIAQAYGIPWALCVPAGSEWNMPFKWRDWFAYLGIGEPVRVANLDDGRKWWNETGHRGRVRDLEPLLNSFPFKP